MKIPDPYGARGQESIARMIKYREEQIEKMENEIEELRQALRQAMEVSGA